jgi:23S rRNA (uracil1939-C5)-methyltransferase
MGTKPIYSFVARPSRRCEFRAMFSMLVQCPHADRCPGCPFIGLDAADQLERKGRAVAAAFAAYPALANTRLERVVGAESASDYRVRAKLVAQAGKLGLFARGSHEVVDIPACPVLRPRLREAAAAVRRIIADEPQVSAVDLREADDGVLVTVAGTLRGDALERLVQRVSVEVPAAISVAAADRPHDSPRVVAASRIERGPAAARHHLAAGEPYHYATAGAFTQLHAGQAARAYALVAGRLRETLGTLERATILELYSGSGALSLRLAQAGARVTAVESHAPAAALAERAAREQNFTLESLAGDAGRIVAELVAAGRRFDAVVVNPPRRGLAPDVRRLVGTLAPRVLAYVSCEPRTLARDADDLSRLGFALDRVTPFDMIPLSEAVEAIASLTRGPPPPPRVIFENEALVAVSKSPHEPTTPQGEHERSLLARVRALPGAASAVPVHRLDVGTSGVCLFARAPEHVAGLARALGGGTKEYVVLARGIARKHGQVTRVLKESGVERAARTRYVRQRIVGGHSLLVVSPEEGRTHQVRRHLAGIGHPVLGDSRYGDRASNGHFEHAHALDRTFLHLASITLELAGSPRTLRDELAPDLEAVLASLDRKRDRRGG